MKILFVLFLAVYSTKSMEHTPPLFIPAHLRDRIEELPTPHQSMPGLPHKTHSQRELHATIENKTGQEVAIDIRVDELKESADSEKSRYKRLLLLSHGATAVVSILVTTGAAIGIAYAKCHN